MKFGLIVLEPACLIITPQVAGKEIFMAVPPSMFQRLLVAYDGSELSRRALKAAVNIAARLQKPLYAVTVVPQLPPALSVQAFAPSDETVVEEIVHQSDARVAKLLREVREEAEKCDVDVTAEAIAGAEVDAIVDAINKFQCDLLIVGLKPRPGLIDRLVPSTGQAVSDRAPCSILGIR